ncbi:MAG: FtsW/RodA/SpoVE family cell cycle protein [Streptosporangiaceae bacterium]
MSAAVTPSPHRTRRTASLGLLIFAIIVMVAAFAQVGLARDGKLPSGVFTYGLAIAALSAGAFYVMQRFTPYADPVLLPLGVFLNGIGLAMIYRIDQSKQQSVIDAIERAKLRGEKFVPFGSGADVTGQLVWTILSIGLFIAAIILLKDVKILQRYHYTLGAVGMLLLVMPMLPVVGQNINGSRIWINLAGFSLQPAEFCKFAFIAFFAGYLVKKRAALSLVSRKVLFLELPRSRDLFPILTFWFICLVVMAVENDFGTALLFFGLFVAMLYIATGKATWVAIGLLLFIGGALLLFVGAQIIGGPLEHVSQRVEIWLNPEPYFGGGCKLPDGSIIQTIKSATGADVAISQSACVGMDGNYSTSDQLMKGLFAMGQGGVLGTGLGQGQPFLNDLSFSDEIFTSLGEEIGLTGLMALLVVYALLIERGMKVAVQTRDEFAKLFAGGISFVFALQIFAIVGGVTKLIPFTGLTTPFLTQGGSSLLANWILIAILCRLSDQARRPAPVAIQDEGMTQIVNLGDAR